MGKKIKQIAAESTTAGSIATVAMPLSTQQRGGSMFTGKKTNKKFANSVEARKQVKLSENTVTEADLSEEMLAKRLQKDLDIYKKSSQRPAKFSKRSAPRDIHNKQELDEYSLSDLGSDIGDVGRGLYQGVTLGTGENITAAVKSALDPNLTYKQELANQKAANKAAAERSPYLYRGSELLGTVAAPIPGGALAGALVKGTTRAAQAGRVGASIGTNLAAEKGVEYAKSKYEKDLPAAQTMPVAKNTEPKVSAQSTKEPAAAAITPGSFSQAFAAARRAGDKTFTYKGKSYGTRLASEPVTENTTMKKTKLTPHEKFKKSVKRAGYDMDAGADRLLKLLDKQARERAERENKQDKKQVDEWVSDREMHNPQPALSTMESKNIMIENPEYDDESGMAHNQLRTMARAVVGLMDTIESGDNLPEWVQKKLTLAEHHLVTVWDYLQSEPRSKINEDLSSKFIVKYHNNLSDETKTVLVKADDEYDAKDKINFALGRGSIITDVRPAKPGEKADQEYKVYKDPRGGAGYTGIFEQQSSHVRTSENGVTESVAQNLGREAFRKKQGKKANPYHKTREADKHKEWNIGHDQAAKDTHNATRFRKSVTETQQCPECGGAAYDNELIAEEKDACYSKVKSRYKVWPSAYASGALVKCRKVGAKNWGNKSKKK